MLTATFWDVDHGLAVYLTTPNKRIVIDLGIGSSGKLGGTFSPLRHVRAGGVSQLDGVVITHPHGDHIDDIGNFDALGPMVLVRPRHLTENAIREANKHGDRRVVDKYLEIDRRFSDPVAPESSPFRQENNGGTSFQFFVPSSCDQSNINNHSVVTVVSCGGVKLLVPGDNEPPSWGELLARADFRAAIEATHVVLAPHHGRESGFHAPLFDHIQPLLVVISDGRFCDTSATDRYAKNAKGYSVTKRSGGTEDRKCVTTRSDGVVVIEAWAEGSQRHMAVTVD